MNIRHALLFDAYNYNQGRNIFGIYHIIQKELCAILTELIPASPLFEIIFQYLLPTMFELMSEKIKSWKSQELIEKPISIGTLKQQSGSSDCGYWSLLHVFMLIIDTPFAQGFFNYYKDKKLTLRDERENKNSKSLNSAFGTLKAWVKENIRPLKDDLTVTDIASAFDRLVESKENNQYSEPFPGLRKKLILWQQINGIPPYTIINSNTMTHFCFGGTAPALKMQIATNFYALTQNIQERQLHCILIGTEGNWHVQLLATSYFFPESITFFQLDSADTSPNTLELINLHLVDLLKNPLNYAQLIGDELLSPLYQQLLKLSKTKNTPTNHAERIAEIQNGSKLLIQFFTSFGKLDFAKKYLNALEMAKTITNREKSSVPEFEELSQQLTVLFSKASSESVTHGLK